VTKTLNAYTQSLLVCLVLPKFAFQSNAERVKLTSELKYFLDGAGSFRI